MIENLIIMEEYDMTLRAAVSDPDELLFLAKQERTRFCNSGFYLLDIELNSHMNGLELAQRIREFEVEKECYYALYNSTEIYPFLKEDILLAKMLERIRPVDLKFMKQIVYPYKRKEFVYDMTFTEWFFCENRIGNLIEVTENG